VQPVLTDFFDKAWQVMLELSPSLLLGLLIAGLLHVFLPRGFIHRRLSGSRFRSVAEATLLGVPLPLCSCGVVPTALGLRNDGASRGAATGFLISTPQTGVDSIFVSATFLGWPFALFKVVAAMLTGLLGGQLVNLSERNSADHSAAKPPVFEVSGRSGGLSEVLRYAVFELLAMIDIWILIGVAASALIAVLIPAGSLADVSWLQGIWGMLLVLAIAMPLYVCTTGSVPIAASLIAAGMPLGSALVFLMAGPATNLATIGAVFRGLGKRVVIIYLLTVAGMSIIFGLLFDWVLGSPGAASVGMGAHAHQWYKFASAILVCATLFALLGRRIFRRLIKSKIHKGEIDMQKTLKVEGMTCEHCVATVKKALESDPAVSSASPDLASGLVSIEGENLNLDALAGLVEQAGYKAKPAG